MRRNNFLYKFIYFFIIPFESTAKCVYWHSGCSLVWLFCKSSHLHCILSLKDKIYEHKTMMENYHGTWFNFSTRFYKYSLMCVIWIYFITRKLVYNWNSLHVYGTSFIHIVISQKKLLYINTHTHTKCLFESFPFLFVWWEIIVSSFLWYCVYHAFKYQDAIKA